MGPGGQTKAGLLATFDRVVRLSVPPAFFLLGNPDEISVNFVWQDDVLHCQSCAATLRIHLAHPDLVTVIIMGSEAYGPIRRRCAELVHLVA